MKYFVGVSGHLAPGDILRENNDVPFLVTGDLNHPRLGKTGYRFGK